MRSRGFVQAADSPSIRQFLTLLIGQSIFFGIGLSLWYVAANTLFLIDWGASRLPWVFIGVAIFVSLFSYGLTELQRRWSPARVVIFIGLTLTTFCLLARLSLSTAFARPAALALETLDVMLASEEKALVLPLVKESMPLVQRVNALDRYYSLPRLERTMRLGEIIADTSLWTQSWTRACAIYAAGKLAVTTLADAIEHTLTLDKHPIRETAVWALTALDGGNGDGSSREETRRTQVSSMHNQSLVTPASVGRIR